MNEILSFWAQWLRPSAGLPTVQWSLLLAVAAMAGYLTQRHTGLPKVVGYSLVGTAAGLAGFSGAVWPLQGIGLFLLELGVAIVLFECGGRIPLRWFRHNPMVLVQSIAESVLTYFAVYWVLVWLQLPPQAAGPLALVALAASPAVLTRVVADTRAAGPVTERAIVLTTLSTLYALTLGSAKAELINRQSLTVLEAVSPVVVVLGVSIVVAAVLALVLRMALRFMSPTSENTSMLFLALVAAGTAVAAHMGGSAPLAALLGGMLLKQLNPRPWAWPRQLGNASSLLTMLMFVLVSTVAAQADWSAPVAGVVLALIAVRLLAKATGVALGNGQRRQLEAGAVGGLRDDPHVLHRPADRLAVCARVAFHRPCDRGCGAARHLADGGIWCRHCHRGHLPCGRKLQTLGTPDPQQQQRRVPP